MRPSVAIQKLEILEKRVIALESWIEYEGDISNICTHNILNKVCTNCKCNKKRKSRKSTLNDR